MAIPYFAFVHCSSLFVLLRTSWACFLFSLLHRYSRRSALRSHSLVGPPCPLLVLLLPRCFMLLVSTLGCFSLHCLACSAKSPTSFVSLLVVTIPFASHLCLNILPLLWAISAQFHFHNLPGVCPGRFCSCVSWVPGVVCAAALGCVSRMIMLSVASALFAPVTSSFSRSCLSAACCHLKSIRMFALTS